MSVFRHWRAARLLLGIKHRHFLLVKWFISILNGWTGDPNASILARRNVCSDFFFLFKYSNYSESIFKLSTIVAELSYHVTIKRLNFYFFFLLQTFRWWSAEFEWITRMCKKKKKTVHKLVYSLIVILVHIMWTRPCHVMNFKSRLILRIFVIE